MNGRYPSGLLLTTEKLTDVFLKKSSKRTSNEMLDARICDISGFLYETLVRNWTIERTCFDDFTSESNGTG